MLHELPAFLAREATRHAQTRTALLTAVTATVGQLARMHAQALYTQCMHCAHAHALCEHIGSARLGGRLAEGMFAHSAQKIHVF